MPTPEQAEAKRKICGAIGETKSLIADLWEFLTEEQKNKIRAQLWQMHQDVAKNKFAKSSEKVY
jgi:hypothetical protein